MASSAPRYDERIVDAIKVLDDRREPIAEICRRVGRCADKLGLPRPSYVHIRRLVHAERERQDAICEIIDDVLSDIYGHRVVNAYEVAERVRNING
jgi:hypothetical protein